MSSIWDFTIIGGGIIGLATAVELSRRFEHKKILVLDKEADIARHQTGHNSGVIHSGIYYRPGSLKAETCVAGAELLKEFCRRHHIPTKATGKVIVATDRSQLPQLEELHRKGQANGVPGVEIITASQLAEIEPYARGVRALWVPSTGIVDYREVCRRFREIVEAGGGKILLQRRVRGIERKPEMVRIHTQHDSFGSRYLFNCAGLHADRMAHLAKVDCDVKIVPFRGEYYKLVAARRHLVKGLIYPVPDPSFPFLGVHLTNMIDGSVEAGPNAVLALRREGYEKTSFSLASVLETFTYPGFWRLALRHWRRGLVEVNRSFSKKAFVESVRHLVPAVTYDDLVPYKSGVRAQALTMAGDLVDDFCVVTAERMVHVVNAPSPAATACIAIARQIVDMAAVT